MVRHTSASPGGRGRPELFCATESPKVQDAGQTTMAGVTVRTTVIEPHDSRTRLVYGVCHRHTKIDNSSYIHPNVL